MAPFFVASPEPRSSSVGRATDLWAHDGYSVAILRELHAHNPTYPHVAMEPPGIDRNRCKRTRLTNDGGNP